MLRLVRNFLRPYTSAIVIVSVLQLVQTLAALYLPTLNARIIDQGVVTGDTDFIMRTGAIMLGISLVQMVANVIAIYFGARTAMALGRDLREALFGRIMDFSAQEMSALGTPSLITRSTNDVQQVQMFVFMSLTMIITAPIMLVGGIIMAVQEDTGLSLLLVVVVPVLGGTMALVAGRMVPYFRSMQKRIDSINGILREQITGIRVVRAFVKEGDEQARFAVANTALRDVAIRVGWVLAFAIPLVMLIVNVASVGVMWFGAQRVDSGAMEIGSIVAFLSYLMFILFAVMMATMMFMFAPRAVVSGERIDEVLGSEPTVLAPLDPKRPAQVRGAVEFDTVDFHYPGAEASVLHGVSFRAEPGRTTAIIGSTGSGKTTLLNLVPRLFDASEGAVRIDGIDVRDIAPEIITGEIGLIPQKPYLFSGTVASNLRYGREDATDEEMWDALRVAQAENFVRSMDGGLEAEIAQGGTNVSGGQRQRLAIARALIRKPSIYLFDDSFSALDYATDAALRSALRPRTRDASVIIVAQRVSTIRDADQILVLEHGRVVGRGTHEELLATNETYQEIVSSQLTAAEAA
ncbi:ABC transporter ATP-binding protein [Occultella aeris]|uniref:Multidrug export ATP-binding/permease protein n=1 Tax=Occultella aeris TaxID=2761496 RepID=A0A7M4DR40_9MICO|nr:ABC transporter ATP-binding protein [Occultella aeris]VZO39934.1 Putative multidrug export ATP-binding/permease protein [Occultella aeris]